MNHKILCDKLTYYGFRGKINNLISSYLSNRTQYVSINGYDSKLLPITCGVPQGSTLGPLLFLLYINDLKYSLKYSTASHFADDTCLLYAARKTKSIESYLNYDLKNLSDWLHANRLSLNVTKTKLLLFHSKNDKTDYNTMNIKIEGFRLKFSDTVKYLEITVDNNLSWDSHIGELSHKLSKANGIMSKLRLYISKTTLRSVYFALFYSHMNYGSLVWTLTTKKNLEKISILQRKCIRIINFLDYRDPTTNNFYTNKIIKFSDTIITNQLILAYQFNNKQLPLDLKDLFVYSNEIHRYNTRCAITSMFHIPSIRSTHFGKKSLKFTVPQTLNTFSRVIPNILSTKSKYSLKNLLNKHFLNLYKIQ